LWHLEAISKAPVLKHHQQHVLLIKNGLRTLSFNTLSLPQTLFDQLGSNVWSVVAVNPPNASKAFLKELAS
jgi:hypothetical protein